jgi:hypothetical protein
MFPKDKMQNKSIPRDRDEMESFFALCPESFRLNEKMWSLCIFSVCQEMTGQEGIM